MWRVIETPPSNAEKIMLLDAKLLETLKSSDNPLLHFYEWERPSATYGYFTDPNLFLQKHVKNKLDLAKRPTGGGLIFHTVDFAFSLCVPADHPRFSLNTLENYAFVHEIVMDAIQPLIKEIPHLLDRETTMGKGPGTKFCMANPTIYDVMIGGRKVVGAAQRKKVQGFLHQGSIAITLPEDSFLDEVLLDSDVKESMKKNTFSLLPKANLREIQEMRKILKQRLKQAFQFR